MKLNLDLIKHRLSTKNLNQTELAKAIGVTHPAITQWLNNSNFPSLLNLFRLSHILGLSIEDIVDLNKNDIPKRIRNKEYL